MPVARSLLGQFLGMAGRTEDALRELDTAIRLSPRDPQLWTFHAGEVLRVWPSMSVATLRTLCASFPEAAVEEAFRALRLAGWEPDDVDAITSETSASRVQTPTPALVPERKAPT